MANLEQMEANLETWRSIRDDTKNNPKDRIEAAKNIQKALGGMSAERAGVLGAGPQSGTGCGASSAGAQSPPEANPFDITDEEKARLDTFLVPSK
jgi:hypothetical protein